MNVFEHHLATWSGSKPVRCLQRGSWPSLLARSNCMQLENLLEVPDVRESRTNQIEGHSRKQRKANACFGLLYWRSKPQGTQSFLPGQSLMLSVLDLRFILWHSFQCSFQQRQSSISESAGEIAATLNMYIETCCLFLLLCFGTKWMQCYSVCRPYASCCSHLKHLSGGRSACSACERVICLKTSSKANISESSTMSLLCMDTFHTSHICTISYYHIPIYAYSHTVHAFTLQVAC